MREKQKKTKQDKDIPVEVAITHAAVN